MENRNDLTRNSFDTSLKFVFDLCFKYILISAYH